MKKLESKSIEQLLSIIPEHPATRIMHISDGGEELSDSFRDFVEKHDYEYLLNTPSEEFFPKAKERYAESKHCIIKKIKLQQRNYASMAKRYDYLFVTADIPEEMQEEFTKRVHPHIKNAGNIILFLPKNDLMILDRWRGYLEENFYVAINNIDMFENYEILIAKKMHGWGG